MSQLHKQLRASTRESHENLEQSAFFKTWVAGELPLTAYVDWLRVMTVLTGVLEQELDRSSEPVVQRLWRPEMRRLHLLRADAAAFDVVPSHSVNVVKPVLHFVQELRRWAIERPVGLLGALYVFEGSVLGASILRDKLGALGDRNGKGQTYLSVSAESSGTRWPTFRRELDALELDSEQESQVIQTAEAVFRLLGEVLDALHPVEAMRITVANMLNDGAGRHAGSRDPREVAAGIDAGNETWNAFPYFEARYGARGRRFTHSDTVWLITLASLDWDGAVREIKWLAGVLAHRGMPSLLLEHHLYRLRHALIGAVPERQPVYERLGELAQYLKDRRLAALPDFHEIAETFTPTEPIAGVGAILAGAVADEASGIADASGKVKAWLTSSARFPEHWIAAVRQTLELARAHAAEFETESSLNGR